MAIIRPAELPETNAVTPSHKLIVDKLGDGRTQSITVANFTATAGGTPPDNSVTNVKLADMAAKTWKRGPATGTGDPINDTTANALADLVAAGALRSDQTKTITVGYTVAAGPLGVMPPGTTALDPTLGNYQYLANNGAFTLAAPGAGDCAIDILVTNGASAGSITFSGFTVGSNTGDALTTTSGHRFLVSVRRINGVCTYVIKALQ